MRYLVMIGLLIAAVIHLLPLAGVLGAERLQLLYGLPFTDPDLLILMRHRAVLFGMLGALLLAAAFVRALQPIALAAGLLSVISFLWLAWNSAGYNEAIGRIVAVDLAALVALLLAVIGFIAQRRPPQRS